jgi:4-diphosphocytidyl-2-C-methyl-D-erythritol kinase
MIVFPNCKINLGLRVTGKRDDGFHDLETVFFPIAIKDIIEILPATDDAVHFECSGLKIDGETSNNLCLKAYYLLKRDFPQMSGVRILLHKQIPMGAGLGGGSSDGAFTLIALNEMFNLQLDQSSLIRYALLLGSDCPFFIINQPCYAAGRGELLEPVSLKLNMKAVIIHPGIHVSTAQAFSRIKPAVPEKSLKQIINQPVESWRDELLNDFETTVFEDYPELTNLKQLMYSKGAVYASMTGTGSSIYGLFHMDSSTDFTDVDYRKSIVNV